MSGSFLSDSAERLSNSWKQAAKTLRHSGFDDGFWVGLGDIPSPPSTLRVPCDPRRENVVWLSLAALRAANSAFSAAGANSLVATPLVAGVLGCAHVDALVSRSSTANGKSLFQYAMNPYRVVEKGEYWRIITSQGYSPSTTSFLTHVSDLINATSIIESAWGTWQSLVGIVAASTVGQLVYVGLADLAKTYYPELALAKQFYRYSTGLSITSIAARTMSGYVLDEEESKETSPHGRVFRHRFSWAVSVMLTNALLRLSAGYFSGEAGREMRAYVLLESPGILEVTSGVVAGWLLASNETDPAWLVTDIMLQGLVLVGVWGSYAGPDNGGP